MRELAARYPRYGYRMIQGLLANQGLVMSVDRAYRLWRRAGLQVPRKRPRKRVATGRPRPTPPNSPNHVWAIDFVFDIRGGRARERELAVKELRSRLA
jgi:putative transposase